MYSILPLPNQLSTISPRFTSLSRFLPGGEDRSTWATPARFVHIVALASYRLSARTSTQQKGRVVFFGGVVECKADFPPVQEGALLGLGCFGEIGGVWLLTF